MKIIRMPIFFTLILVVGSVIVAISQGPAAASVPEAASVPASHSPSRKFDVIKECSEYKGTPGSFCTIASSDLPAIPVGSRVFYLQSPIASIGLQDSNIVLDSGEGNRALGHCTFDLASNIGLCTFSDGIGKFAGFHARIDVSAASADLVKFHWRGKYTFTGDDAK